jgi:hypothetical protein
MEHIGIPVSAVDRPQRRLRPVSAPAPLGLLTDCLPTWLMLPMVITAAQHQTVLAPDDRGAHHKAAGDEAFGYSG